jgi:hypothetical protein
MLDRVSKDEAPYFRPQSIPLDQSDEPPVEDNTHVRVLEIVRLAFRKGIKSRFSDGTVNLKRISLMMFFKASGERGTLCQGRRA